MSWQDVLWGIAWVLLLTVVATAIVVLFYYLYMSIR